MSREPRDYYPSGFGFQCSRCPFSAATEDVVKQHLVSAHGVQLIAKRCDPLTMDRLMPDIPVPRKVEDEKNAERPSSTSKAESSSTALFFHLLAPETIRRLAKRLTVGGKKYGIVQWRQGINDVEYVADRYNHLWEHLLRFQQDGNRTDDNLGAMLWAINCLMEVERLCPDVLQKVIGTCELFGPTAEARHEDEVARGKVGRFHGQPLKQASTQASEESKLVDWGGGKDR